MDISALRDDYQVWVPFGGDSEILMRYVPNDERMRLISRATDRRLEDGKVRSGVDHAELARLIVAASVRGWRGLTMDGAEFPYSASNLEMLAARWAEFSVFVQRTASDLREIMRHAREEAIKN